MAFTQSSEPAPTVAKFELLDSASPIFISTIGPTPDERLEAATDDFEVRSAAVTSSCFNGLLCSYLKKKIKNLSSHCLGQQPHRNSVFPDPLLEFSKYCPYNHLGKIVKRQDSISKSGAEPVILHFYEDPTGWYYCWPKDNS